MAYRKRLESAADFYHIFARGTGRRVIFEDDCDRAEFRNRMDRTLSDTLGSLNAWCLMGNHVHLVAHMGMAELSRFMKRLTGGYARFFNSRHGRSGHLFESRFGSEPISSDAQLMAAIRYVHRNPIKPGLSETCDYEWSSFREYTGSADLTDTAPVLDLFGGLEAFMEFHESEGRDSFMDEAIASAGAGSAHALKRMTNDEAVALAKEIVGAAEFEGIASLPRSQRDASLAALLNCGMSVRQVELITGVGRNTVWAAKSRTA